LNQVLNKKADKNFLQSSFIL